MWSYLEENADIPWCLGPELWAHVFELIAKQLNDQRLLYSWMEVGDVVQYLEEQAMIAKHTHSK